MIATLVLPQDLADDLAAKARNRLETAGVLLASLVLADDGTIRVLGRQMEWVGESSYRRRESYGLSIDSMGYVPSLAAAEILGATAIWVHTHPGMEGTPLPSVHDENVDRQISDLFRLRSGSDSYGALVLSPRSSGFAFSGHLESEARGRLQIGRVWIVGDRLSLVRSFDSGETQVSVGFDRNVRAFGTQVQSILGDLRVAVVGCGGTGSSVAEQLVRLGVRRITIFDPDTLSESNLTRIYGSYHAEIGKPKVEILSDHLKRIAPTVQVNAVKSMITVEAAAKHLTSSDIVFGCTDDNAGRLVLSRLPFYLLTPVIDCGVLLSSGAEGLLKGIDGRVTILSPGLACLICRGRIDLSRASAELMTPDERIRRENEGYAPALGRIEPAVVTFTTMVGAAAVGELLERLIGFGPEPRPSEVLIRYHDREISTNHSEPKDHHYCHPASGLIGIGMTSPFLGITWAA